MHSPLLMFTKEQIIERRLALGVDYSLTHARFLILVLAVALAGVATRARFVSLHLAS